MRGIAAAMLSSSLLSVYFLIAAAIATPPLTEPMQDGDFCNSLKVSGTGSFEVGVSIKDRELALEYYDIMSGDGDLELDSGTVEAQRAASLPGMENGSSVPLNLFESKRLAYRGETPLVGMKYIHSKEFWGGIGAEITESFSVFEMEKSEKSYFASTNPASYITDPKRIAELLGASPVHTVAIESKNSFNGSWQTTAHMHKMFSKDLKAHESFSGVFEVDKMIRFRESPIAEKQRTECDGIDC